MIHRDERRLLLESFVDGISAFLHDLLQEHLGLVQRGAGRVDEARLRLLPTTGVALALTRTERTDLELLALLLPLRELGLGRPALAPTCSVVDHPVVLRPEPFLQPLALVTATTCSPDREGDDGHDDHGGDDQDHDGCITHGGPPTIGLYPRYPSWAPS